MPQCIYCDNSAESAEHWLPRLLGTFGPLQVLNDKVCAECNLALGSEIDQEFARVGPEAIFRTGLGIEGRHGASLSPFYFRAATTQPLPGTEMQASGDDAELPRGSLCPTYSKPFDLFAGANETGNWRGVSDEFRNWLRLGLEAREKE
jgi:hypothetical protein